MAGGERRGFLLSPWVQGSVLIGLIAVGGSLQVYSTQRCPHLILTELCLAIQSIALPQQGLSCIKYEVL